MNNSVDLDAVVSRLGEILLGKEHAIRLCVTCLLARGHILLEDLPGMGKTTLAHSLARILGLDYERVQFTSDLLPADILGVSTFSRETESFIFHRGPVFSQVLLADEINRTTPKTQSALLEAMEENQVTVEGQTRALPEPFFVIATQNPVHQSGTFPLPESQLDRFLMRISLGYPDQAAERALLTGADRHQLIEQLAPALHPPALVALQKQVAQVRCSDRLLDYLQALIAVTRNDEHFSLGLSPRGALSWLRAARAWALLHGRDYVVPDDLQLLAHAVVAHRVQGSALPAPELIEYLLRRVPPLEH